MEITKGVFMKKTVKPNKAKKAKKPVAAKKATEKKTKAVVKAK